MNVDFDSEYYKYNHAFGSMILVVKTIHAHFIKLDI